MKTYISIIIAFYSLQLNAQSSLQNFSPSSANLMCNQASNGTFFFQNGNCVNNQTSLYYYFSPIINANLGVERTPRYKISSGAASNYTIYGPFDEGTDYTSLIATNSAPIVYSENVSSYPHKFLGSVIQNKIYLIKINVSNCSDSISIGTETQDFECSNQTRCETCLPKFQPVLGQYVVSAWVKEANNNSATTYTNANVKVTSGSNIYTFYGTGQIIDGWQRIEGIVTTDNVGNLKIELKSNGGTVYFDDIRVFPKDGSMITYVYDPITLRLVAELDERNYAKIYEYDEEGKLIRVKKETEKGVMTIQENRENTHGN